MLSCASHAPPWLDATADTRFRVTKRPKGGGRFYEETGFYHPLIPGFEWQVRRATGVVQEAPACEGGPLMA